MKTVLTIAGSDCIGGAGIQADIKTMTINGVYAMSAITALTAQNTMNIRSIQEVTPHFLAEQLDMIFEDIFPDSVKTGMIFSAEQADIISEKLRYYGAKNIVVDPVIISTSGRMLMKNNALSAMEEKLFPIASIITPNIKEAEIISGMNIVCKTDIELAARIIGEKYGCAVLIKGGHSLKNADDLLYNHEKYTWFNGERIDNPNTHGTGCTLSSAIAANLAKGYSYEESVYNAKKYISGSISAMLNLGKGIGSLNHAYIINKGEIL